MKEFFLPSERKTFLIDEVGLGNYLEQEEGDWRRNPFGKNLICDQNEGNRGEYFGVGILFVFVKVLQGGFSTVPPHFQYHSEKEEIFSH